MDRLQKAVKTTVNLGFGNPEIEMTSRYSDRLEDARKLFFDVVLRSSQHFESLPNRRYFPINSQKLRLFDLVVFKGNDFVQKESLVSNGSLSLVARTFSQGDIFLANQSLLGPYVRLKTDSLDTDYWEKTELDSLGLDFHTISVLETSTIPGCLHQIDRDHCLVCKSNHFPKSNSTKCERCSEDTAQTVFDVCSDFGTVKATKNKANLVVGDFSVSNQDYFKLGETLSFDSRFIVFGNESRAPDYSTVTDYALLDLSNDAWIHFVRIQVELGIPDKSSFDTTSFSLILKSSSGGTQLHKSEYDSGQVSLTSNSGLIEVLIPVSDYQGSSSYTFNKLNFLINHFRKDNVSVDYDSSNTVLEIYSLTRSQFWGFLEDSDSGPGKAHSTSFPVNYFGASNVYHPVGLFGYRAEAKNGLSPSEGSFLIDTNYFSFFRRCVGNCKKCLSLGECLECQKGYFLDGSKCSACSDECLACEASSERCTICRSGAVPKGILL